MTRSTAILINAMTKQIASDSVHALKRVSDDETLREATPDEVRASDEAPAP